MGVIGAASCSAEDLAVQARVETKTPSAMEWNEPKWSYRPRVKAELSAILNLKMWLRVLVVVVLLTILLAYAVNRALPRLVEFNWVRGLILSCLALVAMLGMQLGILWFVPPVIRITAKGISRQATSLHWRLRSEIRSIYIDTRSPIQPLICVESYKRSFIAGVGPTIEPACLISFLKQTFPEILVEERK